MKVEYVCDICGSDQVSRDAWADWDTATQQWTLGAVFDYAHCHRCEKKTHLTKRPAEAARRRSAADGDDSGSRPR
jgi:hypothetical protein